ncbi:hypothetical protein [Streptomyces umbrinus]|uniref:hypothetical protein n=1 Tax=Streptomyces umbrinus TaxID=67370 RepID=UPI0033C2C5F3
MTSFDHDPEQEKLDQQTGDPENRKRPFFVIGQWLGGGKIDIWRVEEAPSDPDERATAHEQYWQDAEDAFGSVEVVYATNPETAAEQARREAL